MMFFSLFSAAAAVKSSPVAKVIELLDELTGKVKGDLAAEEMMMEEYSKWCDTESNEKEDAITSGKRTIGDLGSEIADATARISELSTEVEELAGKISSTESELKGATELRKKEAADFQGSEAELVETMDSLERAVTVIKRGQVSFLQQRDRDDFKKVTDGLSKIIEANWVSKQDKAAVQALLQAGSSDSDEDLSLNPQASTSNYDSHGGGILDTLTDMKTKAESTLSDARTAEMKAQHSYEMLKRSLEMELSTMEKRMSEATTEKSGLEEVKASAEEQATRQKDAAGELAAIAKAKEVLESGVKVFLQVSTKAKVRDAGSESKRERIMSILSKIA